jgi:hypothetical protein
VGSMCKMGRGERARLLMSTEQTHATAEQWIRETGGAEFTKAQKRCHGGAHDQSAAGETIARSY